MAAGVNKLFFMEGGKSGGMGRFPGGDGGVRAARWVGEEEEDLPLELFIPDTEE